MWTQRLLTVPMLISLHSTLPSFSSGTASQSPKRGSFGINVVTSVVVVVVLIVALVVARATSLSPSAAKVNLACVVDFLVLVVVVEVVVVVVVRVVVVVVVVVGSL